MRHARRSLAIDNKQYHSTFLERVSNISMAGISSTSFMLILFGVLLLSGSVPTLARTPMENNIIREVIVEQEAMNISPLKNVDIIMRPKANTPMLRCVGYMEQCGPLYPCCGSNTCTFILAKLGFYCYA